MNSDKGVTRAVFQAGIIARAIPLAIAVHLRRAGRPLSMRSFGLDVGASSHVAIARLLGREVLREDLGRTSDRNRPQRAQPLGHAGPLEIRIDGGADSIDDRFRGSDRRYDDEP